jgi:anti-sigma factor RsiW
MSLRGLATLTCQEFVELVTDLLSGDVPPEDRALLEQHLLVCPPCTLHLAQMKTTIEVTGRLRSPPDSLQPPEELLEVFRRWQAK